MATVYSLICWGGRTGKTVSLSASTDVVTSTNHGLRNGTKLWPSGTLPAELNTSTPVYARSTAANTFTLYDTPEHAIAGGATGQILFAGASTYAAVVLKSDLVANAASALSPYGLSDLSRWGSSGSERIYDGLVSWRTARNSAATQFDPETAEIGMDFVENITGSSFTAQLAKTPLTTIETKINGIRTGAFHAGVYGSGYTIALYLLTMNSFATIDGITVNAGNPIQSNGLVSLNASVQSTVKNCFIYGGNTAWCFGVTMWSDNLCIVDNNVIIAVKEGIVNYGCTNAKVTNNIVVKCAGGFVNQGNSLGYRYGYWYNNISIGNTTNWGTEPADLQGASNNFGLVTDTPWAIGAGTVGTIATTDFVDYTNNDFRPANSSSPQVDTGIVFYGIATTDIAGAERPNYNNGGAEGTDVGAYEFDHGYGLHPTSDYRGLTFTDLIAGSTLKVFETGTTTELFSDTSTATSETWSENSAGSKTVDYTILKDGYVPIRVTGITVTGALSGGIVSTPIQQKVSRTYQASSGLTYGSTATITTGTKQFAVTVATTIQNFYSFCCEAWRTETALKNTAFPLSENGPNSIQLSDDWAFSSGSIAYLSRDGMRTVNASGTITGIWAAVLSVGVPSGMQVRYQQIDGSGTTNAANTGNVDQLIKIYENGSYDYTGHLVLKVQSDGYDQAEFDLVSTFGTLEDQFYVAGLTPVANGITSGSVTGVTITDHGASPVTWNSKSFSITITDTTGHTGAQILQYVRGLNSFNYHDLVQTNGTEFKTVRGKLYGDTGASLKGVRVVQSDGTTSHADFNLHTADDGTTYIPPLPPAAAEATILADSRVQLFNVTTDTEIDNAFEIGTNYNYVITTEASSGDVLRLRVCKLGKEVGEAFAVWGASGATFLITQPDSAEYATWGIDGSTVTEFTGDVSGHIYIDANDLDGATTKTRLGAWYSWVLTTEIGIRHFFGAVTYVSSAAIRINQDIADILIENVNSITALRFTDLDVRLYREDGSSVIAPTSYSIHNDYSGVPDVTVVSVSGSNVITGDIADIPSYVPSASDNANAVASNSKILTVAKFLGLK